MMKRVIVGFLFGILAFALGCAQKPEMPTDSPDSAGRPEKATQGDGPTPKLTREFLLAHGFKLSPGSEDLYELKNVRLGDVSRDLGFPLVAFDPARSQPIMNSDCRYVPVRGRSVRVHAEAFKSTVTGDAASWAGATMVPKVRYGETPIRTGSLDDPNALCSVFALLKPEPGPEYRETESCPRLRIISATFVRDRPKQLQATFELAAEGKTPLCISRGEIFMGFAPKGKSPRDLSPLSFSYAEGTPREITLLPGKSITLTVTTSHADYGPRWARFADLPAGEFLLCVGIAAGEQFPRFDYHWTGIAISDDHKLVVK